MLFLNVPYAYKDTVKALGARWNPDAKKWFVPKRTEYSKFLKWFPDSYGLIVCDHIYIVEGKTECFKCGNSTRVVAFGVDYYCSYEKSEDFYSFSHDTDEIHLAITLENLPVNVIQYLCQHYNYKMRTSKTTGITKLNYCCDHCDVLQGDFFLKEPSSPFFILSSEQACALKLYKIKLSEDFFTNDSLGYSSTDHLIKLYGKFQ